MRRLHRAAALGVLPLALLLAAQWPLRDLLHAGSRQANDAAQVVFALCMACAVDAATRAGVHLAAGHGPEAGRWRAWALLACVGPWAAFLLWTSAAPVWQSIVLLERFPETLNPGYFVVRTALWLLGVLVLVDAVRAAWRRPGAA